MYRERKPAQRATQFFLTRHDRIPAQRGQSGPDELEDGRTEKVVQISRAVRNGR